MNYKEEAIKMLEEGREVYPLHDIDGNITGVVGRNILSRPKYKVYGTGFFGNFNTYSGKIIITEGIVDVLIAQTEKYDNIVTFSGVNPDKAFTDDVLKRLAEMNKKFVLFFDNDKMGQKSANMLCKKMKEYGIDVYNFTPVFGESDLMDYIKHGRSLEAVLNTMTELFATGTFAFSGYMVQQFHSVNNCYDDDVVSRKNITELLKSRAIDGYVSNIGTEVTIHIKPEFNVEFYINLVKEHFGLYEKYGVTKVIIEETDIVF